MIVPRSRPSMVRCHALVRCWLVVGTLALLGCEGDAERASPESNWSPILQAERQRPLTDTVFDSTPERLERV